MSVKGTERVAHLIRIVGAPLRKIEDVDADCAVGQYRDLSDSACRAEWPKTSISGVYSLRR